jgi:hypothetical protein
MNFGINQLFEKTPKAMVVIGHFLLVTAASAASLSTIYPSISNTITIASVVGTLLTSLFGEKKISENLKK